MSKPRLISASQIGTFNDCRRFWWLQRIERLSDGPPQAHFTLGTVLHAVCERWLSADEQGRVPQTGPNEEGEDGGCGPDGRIVYRTEGPLNMQEVGAPVELYPTGWESTIERDGSTGPSVTPTEAKLIKRLVAEAIEEGILVREPGTVVERELRVPVIEGVELIGYADVFRDASRHRERPLIEDHKSFGKGSVRFLMRSEPDSPNHVGKNEQLKTYAWATSELDGWDGDVDVCHNQFPKFAGRPVSKASGVITAEAIQEHGESLRKVAGEMVRTSHIKKWEDVSGPTDSGKCSRWYGKECPFAGICTHRETIPAYKERSERALENHQSQGRLDLPLPKPKKRGKTAEPVMSLFDKVKAEKARKAADPVPVTAKAAPAINPVTDAAAPTAAAPTAAAPTAGAPWATADCTACKGRGVTSKGRGCPMCDAKAKRAKRPTSMHYVIEAQDDGTVIASSRDGKEDGLEAAGMPEVWIESEGADEASQEAQEPQDAPEATVEAPVEQDAAEEQPEASVEEPKKARSKAIKDEIKASGSDAVPSANKVKAKPIPKTTATGDVKGEVTVKQKAKGRKKRAQDAPAFVGNEKGIPLIVLVGSVPLRPIEGVKVLTSREMLDAWGLELAQDMGAQSYWDLDPFKRRDRLASKAADIAEASQNVMVIHPGSLANDDTGVFIQSLMALPQVTSFLSAS